MILVLNQASISAVFPIVRFARDQKTALTGESLYHLTLWILNLDIGFRPQQKTSQSTLPWCNFSKPHTIVIIAHTQKVHLQYCCPKKCIGSPVKLFISLQKKVPRIIFSFIITKFIIRLKNRTERDKTARILALLL